LRALRDMPGRFGELAQRGNAASDSHPLIERAALEVAEFGKRIGSIDDGCALLVGEFARDLAAMLRPRMSQIATTGTRAISISWAANADTAHPPPQPPSSPQARPPPRARIARCLHRDRYARKPIIVGVFHVGGG
jgi:hypothetical protein